MGLLVNSYLMLEIIGKVKDDQNALQETVIVLSVSRTLVISFPSLSAERGPKNAHGQFCPKQQQGQQQHNNKSNTDLYIAYLSYGEL